jgi:tRNA A37 N6-isopentenylltransferase MiaA
VAASAKTRAERKAETLQARRKGELPVGGEGTYKSSLSQQTATAKSTKTRQERKAETMQAIKDHQTMQPGEAA